RHGILLVCDEIMCGMGRTGKMFAFQHAGILPDIVTLAKGLTSSYMPLGAMGIRDSIAEYFQTHVFPGGLTYNSHPLARAACEAVIQVMLEEGLVERAATLQPVMRQEMNRLLAKHPSLLDGRCIGLFGMMDLRKNRANERLAAYGASHPAMSKLNQ